MKPRAVVTIALLALAALLALEWFAQRRGGAGAVQPEPIAQSGSQPAAAPDELEPGASAGVARPSNSTRSEVAGAETSDELSAPLESPVSGRVLEPDGSPAVRVAVWVESQSRSASGRDGAYSLMLPNGGHWIFARSVDGLVGERYVEVWSAPVRDADLRLVDGGSIRGRVLEPDGRPRARMRVLATPTGWTRGGHSQDTLTDERGEFLFRGPWLSSWTVEPAPVPPLGLEFEPPQVLRVRPDGDALVFRIVAIPVVRGRVRDARTREPVRSFTVAQRRVENADGAFELEIEEGDPFSIDARGYDVLQVIAAPGEARQSFEVQPSAALGVLAIRVRDERGRPVPRFTVAGVGPHERRWWEHAHAGGVDAGALDPGEHDLTVRAEGCALASTTVEVVSGATTALELALPRSREIPVTVLDESGRPLEQVYLSVLRTDGPETSWEWVDDARADEEPTARASRPSLPISPARWLTVTGRGRIVGLPEGEYLLRWDDRLGAEGERRFRVDADESGGIEFRL